MSNKIPIMMKQIPKYLKILEINTAEKTILILISTSTAFPIADAIKQMIKPMTPETVS